MFGLLACEGPRTVSIQVTIPGIDSVETPALGVVVVALPYDRDSVLAALAARAPTPRPNTAPLDSAFADFRGPFVAFSTTAIRLASLRDSVAAMPAGPSRDAANDSLRAAETRHEAARVTLDTARATLLRRSDRPRGAIRSWENSTYEGWDSIVQGLARERREDPKADTTDAVGRATLTLAPGRRWWIYARSFDASDPNAEWYWNVPVASDTVVLSSKTGNHRIRY